MARAASGVSLILGLSLLASGCAHPDASPCTGMDAPAPVGSPWPARDEPRQQALLTFYRHALRGIDGLTPEDLYTFVRQGVMGGVTAVAGDEGARQVLMARFEAADQSLNRALWTPLDPDEVLGRFHMARYRSANLPFDDLYAAAVATTDGLVRDEGELDWRLCQVRGMVNRGELPLTRRDWPLVAELWETGAPAGHSVSFRHYQQPAYVVLRKVDALPLIKAVEATEGAVSQEP